MSIDKQGFLSDQIDAVRKKNRAAFPEIFKFVNELSELSQSFLSSIGSMQRTMKNFYIAAYFVRALQNCQGAVLMAERGMVTEGYTLVRSGFETLFYMGAAIREPDFVREMSQDHVKRTKQMAEAHLKELVALDPSINPDEHQLQTLVDNMMALGIDPAQAAIIRIADKAEKTTMYNTFYRQLSNVHAHPTTASLNSIITMGPNDVPDRIDWGPERGEHDDVVDVLTMVCLVLLDLLTEWVNYQPSAASKAPLTDLAARYEKFLQGRNA